MREKMKKLLLKANMANVLGAFALLITVVSANRSCVFIFHQPEAPDELKQLRNEYSCAVTPQIRQTGNRLSGNAGTAYASLLA